MKKLSEGDLLAMLKRNDSTRSPERQRTDETLKSMKEVYNLALDLAAENATMNNKRHGEIVEISRLEYKSDNGVGHFVVTPNKESILNLKID